MATKKAGVGSEASGAMASKYRFNGGEVSKLRLTPHDINIISIVAQKPKVEYEALMSLILNARPSKNAIDIVNIMLMPAAKSEATKKSKTDKKAMVKLLIANNYEQWAKELSRS